ncbi:hypothetical protein P7B02_14835 [Caulobacter segnis]|uniref:hypothetical protein n=1 Tax=Caulobacter segnis TaxID=88688 RepID=UPI00240F82DB|nr:hypothetical protein [Caulobacter segnis]MDG2522812.1 hypothetical protein [Caulobacter segnis]
MRQRQLLDAFVLELNNATAAREAYESLPAPLKPGAELLIRHDSAQIATPSADAAEWLKTYYCSHGGEALAA